MGPRRRTFIGLGLAGAALVAALVVAEHRGWPFLREPVQRAATRAAAVPVRLEGPFRLHLFGRPRIEVGQLNLASAERFGAPHLVDARGVRLSWRWGDIWRWWRGDRLRLQALSADALDARLRRLDDGSANWQLGAREPRPEAEPLGGLPRFGSLVIGQGEVDWKDPIADVDIDIRLRGREGEAEAANAGYQASFSGRYRALPLRLQAHAGGTLPLLNDPETAPDAPWVPVRVEGTAGAARLRFDGEAAALLGLPRLRGALALSGPSLAAVGRPLGITLPRTPPFELRGTLSQGDGVWRLQAERAHIGSSRLAGDLRFHQRARPRRLTGELQGQRLALADLGPAIGAGGGAAAPAPQGPRRVLPQHRFDLPSLQAMDADVRVAIGSLDFGTRAMAPLRGLRTRVRLAQGVLRLDDLRAEVAGGRVEGMTQLDATARPAAWRARLEMNGVDVAGWLRGLRREGAPAPSAASALKRERERARQGGEQGLKSYLTGVLSARLDVTGAGQSTAEILGSLDGPIDLRLRDGTISHVATEAMGLDLAQALGVVVGGDRPLPLRCARFDLRAREGVVEPRLAVLDNRDSTVHVAGRVNLRDESLALRLVTRPKDWSPLSLRTPVTVGGTLGQPKVGIEGGRLAGRVAGAIALGAAAGPAAAVIPFIERGRQEDGDPCEPSAPAAPANKR